MEIKREDPKASKFVRGLPNDACSMFNSPRSVFRIRCPQSNSGQRWSYWCNG